MILGIGIDIIELARLEKTLNRTGERFLDRVFTAKEQKEAEGKLSYLAGRWAAKEAVSKALGCGIGAKCSFLDTEILNNVSGAPELTCVASARFAFCNGNIRWHISISHEKAYATAMVIMESAE